MREAVFVKSEAIVSRQIDDEAILVPIQNNIGDLESIYNLNEVGARIWELLDGKNTVQSIISIITHEFEVSETQAEDDTMGFIRQLAKIGAIEKNTDHAVKT